MKILEINKFNFVSGGVDKHFLDLTALLKARGNEVAVFYINDSLSSRSTQDLADILRAQCQIIS